MALQIGSQIYDRKLRFSNPNVSVSGSPTGTTLRNVARRIDEYAPTIAGFKPERLTASISGPTNIQPLVQNTWEANVSCGSGYTYQWAESNDGINYINISGATNITFSQLNYPGASFARYKRVRVTSTDGQNTNAFIFVTLNGVSATIPSIEDSKPIIDFLSTNLMSEVGKNEIQTFPNPVSTVNKINLKIINEGKVRLDLIDNDGKLVENLIDSELKKGNYDQQFDTSKLKEGIYYLKLSSLNEVQTIRLILK